MTDLPANYEILSNGYLAHGIAYLIIAALGLLMTLVGIRLFVQASKTKDDNYGLGGTFATLTGIMLMIFCLYQGLPRVLSPGSYVVQPCRGLGCP